MTTFPTTTKSADGEVPDLVRASGVLTIDLAALAENYRRLKARSIAPAVAAVIKADGYGLDAGVIAPVLVKAGARTFFVAQLEEAIALRPVLDDAFPACSLYVLNGLMRGAERDYRELQIQPVLNSLSDIEAWRAYCQACETPLPAALHIDTGMNRLGLPADEIDRLAAQPDLLQGMVISLIISHLACAEEPDHPKNEDQLAAFIAATERLPPAPRSLANSSGCFLDHRYHFDLLRPGIALYGGNPTPGKPNPMAQVIDLKCRILQVRNVDAPHSVGYGATHRVAGSARIATVAAGYADGYLRSLSNQAHAWIGEHRVPLVGRVSMDLVTFDVTLAPEELAQSGAWVDLIGPDDGLDLLASQAETIGYQILTALGRRYHRHYIHKNG